MTDKLWGKNGADVFDVTRASSSEDSERLLRALRVAVPVEDPTRVSARRNFLVNVIEREIKNTPRRIKQQERRLRWSRIGLAAAAVLLVAGAGNFAVKYQAPLVSSGVEDASGTDGVAEGRAKVTLHDNSTNRSQILTVGQELALNSGQTLHAELPGRTQLELEPLGRTKDAGVKLLHLSKTEQTLFVTAGKLLVDVPESSGFRRHVTVITPQAKVEVKGTKFTVDVHQEAAKQWTIVGVERGEVLVTWLGGHQLLQAGQQWNSATSSGQRGDTTPPVEKENSTSSSERSTQLATRKQEPDHAKVRPTPEPKAASRAATLVEVQATEVVGESSKSIADPSSVNRSTLSQQNRLLERAIQAQRAENYSKATELFDELLFKYPDSPLRSIAITEKRRIKQMKH